MYTIYIYIYCVIAACMLSYKPMCYCIHVCMYVCIYIYTYKQSYRSSCPPTRTSSSRRA